MALVTMNQYRELLKDRPRKFSAAEVGFAPKAKDARQRCQFCFHWYQAPVAGRSTCEIFIGVGEARDVAPEASCRYWTRDGESFPQLEPPRK